jgi:hypothetical protein
LQTPKLKAEGEDISGQEVIGDWTPSPQEIFSGLVRDGKLGFWNF